MPAVAWFGLSDAASSCSHRHGPAPGTVPGAADSPSARWHGPRRTAFRPVAPVPGRRRSLWIVAASARRRQTGHGGCRPAREPRQRTVRVTRSAHNPGTAVMPVISAVPSAVMRASSREQGWVWAASAVGPLHRWPRLRQTTQAPASGPARPLPWQRDRDGIGRQGRQRGRKVAYAVAATAVPAAYLLRICNMRATVVAAFTV